MQPVSPSFSILRACLLAVALAAVSILLARGDSPAAATSYSPHLSVSVSDPTPGAAADIVIGFSVDKPDSFPNVKTDSSIQFLPRQWGVHSPETDGANAPQVGGIAGTFDALTSLGILGNSICVFSIPVVFTMYDASVDTSNVTSALDIGGDLHPGGVGYSGQFATDPATAQTPGDLGMPLRAFNANEKYADSDGMARPFNGRSDYESFVYRDVDNSNTVSVGDIRLSTVLDGAGNELYPAGSVVQEGDHDIYARNLYSFPASEKHSNPDGNDQMDAGEMVYKDLDGSGTVSYGDLRLSNLGTQGHPTTVQDFQLTGGISRYPDFLNQMIPPSVVGDPLARMFGAQNVLGVTAVSLNIVTYRPGQLPGYPATLGYPNIVVLLDPVAPIDMKSINMTSDMCSPLSLTSTNLGVSRDNPATAPDEGGYVRLTNPRSEKSHDFTLVTTSQPDADNDGIENMLDTCALTPNTEDLDARSIDGVDHDNLDASCDPDPANPSPQSAQTWISDQDLDNYGNRADNCPIVANGIEALGTAYRQVPGFTFYWAITGDLIGPSNQADTDGDDIGDACEGAESGGPGATPADQQCVNATDDDGDGAVNDGCPVDIMGPESGAQCLNATDDDGDGKVNDGCPRFPLEPRETGDQCANATDDDGDGFVNDGCPQVGFFEYGWRCSNAVDDDGDGFVNDGCSTYPAQPAEDGWKCNNALDDDGDGLVNDGCAAVFSVGTLESGDQCNNAVDDDADGLVNDGCPAVDPGWYATTHITGHMHVVTLTASVLIEKHGVKLNTLGGPKTIKDNGSRSYSVAVSNLSGSTSENVQVALRVVEGCARVNGAIGENTAVVSLAPDASSSVSFSVDFTGCAAGEYTVQADACHGGDAAPAGFFGSGSCPGYAGHGELVTGLVPLASATASSEYDAGYSAKNAIDGSLNSVWCSSDVGDPNPVLTVTTATPANIDSIDMTNPYFGEAFRTGTITMSNGFSVGVTLDSQGQGSVSFPTQTGIEWVRFTSVTKDPWDACFNEFKLNGSWYVTAPDPNPLDDAPMAESVVVGNP